MDLLYPFGASVIPIEIKSAMTFHADFESGIRYFQKLTGSMQSGRIIYAGETEFVTDGYEVVNFSRAFQ